MESIRKIWRLVGATWMVATLGACSVEDGDPSLTRVGLKKLDVRDGVVNTANGQSKLPSDGEDPTSADSVAIFERTAYVPLKAWCGVCHGAAQAPTFANANVNLAHEALLGSQSVNFQAIEQSRVVLRLSKENHNCPELGCEEAAAELVKAIEAWVAEFDVNDGEDGAALKTGTRVFAEAEERRIEGGNPPGVIRLEAESGTFKAPMQAEAVATASGGMVALTPMGAGTQNNAQNAANNNNLGTVIYDFEVKEQGTYRLHGLVNGPTNNTNGFWVRMDNGNLLGWLFTANGTNYDWDAAAATAAANAAPHQFNLTPGMHRLEIRQRREQAKIDALVLTSDPTFNPADAKDPFRDVRILSFDLSELSGVAGATLTIEVEDYSTNGYSFRNPTIELPSGKLRVKNMKLLVNGTFLPQHATYTVVDQTVSAPGAVLSSAALVALKDKGVELDEFSFVFEVLEPAP